MGKVRSHEEETQGWCFNIKIEKMQVLLAERRNKFKRNTGKNFTHSDDTIEEMMYSGSQELSKEACKTEKIGRAPLTGTEFAKLSKTLSDLIPDHLYDDNNNSTLTSHLEEKMNNFENQCGKRMTMRMKWNVLVRKEAHHEKANNRLRVSQKERVALHAEISVTFS
jgi:hypothetical protein